MSQWRLLSLLLLWNLSIVSFKELAINLSQLILWMQLKLRLAQEGNKRTRLVKHQVLWNIRVKSIVVWPLIVSDTVMIVHLHFTAIFDFAEWFLLGFSSLSSFFDFLFGLILQLSQVDRELFLAFVALVDSLYFIAFFISSFFVDLFHRFFIFPKLKSLVETDKKISVLVRKQDSLSVWNTLGITENAIVVPLPHVDVHSSRFRWLDHLFLFRNTWRCSFSFISSCGSSRCRCSRRHFLEILDLWREFT